MTLRGHGRAAAARVASAARDARTMEARVNGVVSVAEFRDLALEVIEPAACDYIDGGAWDELTLTENEAAWRRYALRPRVLVDVSRIDPSTTILGGPAAFPVATAPMAAHGLAHPDGELATARAAAAAGIPFTLSTVSSRSIEEVAAAVPGGRRWFQLYTQLDPGRTRSLVERAAAAGYGAIIVTVDLPVLGYRERDRRSGFDLSVRLGNFADDGPTHAHHGEPPADSGYEVLEEQLARNLTWESLATIRSWSSLPLVLKGVLTAEDARLAVDHGVDAIVVSNHGGRQLDRVPAAIDVLEEIVAAVPGTELWVDGGVRRGLDIAIALALGARGVLVGRPLLWALAAGGQAGVERALAILREEFEIALALLGAPTPADLTRSHVVARPGRT
ncbi:MAG TPA: alpha-hydroxy acid oxidase [Candidatus Limnocylindrales bacterium]|nr:alpha-hydroxy acid oxidase [Candidatus Limnocylindrales bacterium]